MASSLAEHKIYWGTFDSVVPVQDIKAYTGSRGINPNIVTFDTRLVNTTLRPLYHRESISVGTEGWAEPSAGLELLAKRKYSLAPASILNQYRLTSSVVTIGTAVSWP